MSKERKHMQRVRDLGCILCSRIMGVHGTPAESHHVFDTAARSDWLTIPLCYHHHRGEWGFHHLGQRAWEAKWKTTEEQLLGYTIEALCAS